MCPVAHLLVGAVQLVDARFAVEKAALLDGAPALAADAARQAMSCDTVQLVSVAAASLRRVAHVGGGEMRDVLWERVFGPDAAGVDAACFAGFREGIVAGIEVLALLEGFG